MGLTLAKSIIHLWKNMGQHTGVKAHILPSHLHGIYNSKSQSKQTKISNKNSNCLCYLQEQCSTFMSVNKQISKGKKSVIFSILLKKTDSLGTSAVSTTVEILEYLTLNSN